MDAGLADKGAAPLHFDQIPFGAQLFHGTAHRDAADRVLCTQFRLRGDLLVGFVLAALDRGTNVILYLLVKRADLALAQKQARQAQSVYALECAGQQWLAELDAALAQAGGTAELDALLPHGTAREGPGVSAVLEGADGRSLSVFAELTADGGYRVIQWRQSAEWAGEAEAPALFGTLREE